MNKLVKIVTDEDGQPREPVWHAITFPDGAERTLCGGEVFGMGESDAQYEVKKVKRGGITCQMCMRHIRHIKSIKL